MIVYVLRCKYPNSFGKSKALVFPGRLHYNMGNPVLFKTSILMFGSTALAALFMKHSVNKILLALYFFGDTTSILNHGMNSRLAQRLDRIVMAVGACCDLYYMKNITDKKYFGICVASFLSSISSYFISKIFLKSRIVFHASAHFWVTVLHTTQLFVHR